MGYILDTSQSPSSIPHTVIRGRTYYFQMRVPKQHQQLYGQSIRARLSECEEEARTSSYASFPSAQTVMAIKHQS